MDEYPLSQLIVPLAQLAAQPRPVAQVGGKALFLARLRASGLPVPDGLVVCAEVVAMPQQAQMRAFEYIVRASSQLGQRLAVRSSAAMEDTAVASAPGVFASFLDVSPDGVVAAIRRVWESAATPLVKAYAAARGLDDTKSATPVAVPIAVIVQCQVSAANTRSGVLYTRPPGRPAEDRAVIETHFRLEQSPMSAHLPRRTDWATHVDELASQADALQLDTADVAAIAELGMRCETVIGATDGADIEWVAEPGSGAARSRIWIVQARPIVHPRAAPPFPAALLAFSRQEPELEWHLDVTHNPDPLSPAQAGLVERIDQAGLAPYRMRVVGGYLYTASRPKQPEGAERDGLAQDADALRRIFDREVAGAMEQALAAAEAEGAPLTAVVEAYERFYWIYAGRLTPLLRPARRALPAFLATLEAEHMSVDGEALASRILADGSPVRLETLLCEVAAGDRAFSTLLDTAAAMATAWDVAVPTFAEMPGVLEDAVARHRTAIAGSSERASGRSRSADQVIAALRAKLDTKTAQEFDARMAVARVARDIGELDDRFYARAQAALRGALLRQARDWELVQPDDIFFLRLSDVLTWVEGDVVPDRVACRRRAQAARTMRERQHRWRMPLVFRNGRPAQHPPGVAAPGQRSDGRWIGRGTGGQARGIAVRVYDLGELPEPQEVPTEAIFVVATVTPAMVFVLSGAAGVVAQHGGLLDHGAAMARELGLPCVVDCPSVWNEVQSGDELWVDGDHGVVVRTGSSTTRF